MAQKNPGWKQRFDVNSSSSGGYSAFLDAQQKLLDEFAKQTRSADETMAEFEKLVSAQTQMTDRARAEEAVSFRGRLDQVANNTGAQGRTQPGKDSVGKLNDAADEFRNGVDDADNALEELTKTLKTNRAGGVDRGDDRDAKGRFVGPLKKVPTGGGGDDGGDNGGGGGGGGSGGGNNPKKASLIPPEDPLALLKRFGGKTGSLVANMGGAIKNLPSGGPASGPLLVVEAAAKLVANTYNGVSDKVRLFGNVVEKVAKNDGFGAITAVGDGFADMAAKVPVVGEAMSAQIKMYTQFLKTFEQVTDAFAQRGKELKGYSGPIAQAEAEGRVMKVMADLREAQNLGNDYAQVIREQAVMQTEMQRALEPIKHEIMRNLIPLMKAMNVQIKAVGKGLEIFFAGKEKADKAMSDMLMKSFPGLSGVMKQVGKAVDKFLNDGKEENLALKYLMDFANADIKVENAWMGNPDPPQPLGIDLMK